MLSHLRQGTVLCNTKHKTHHFLIKVNVFKKYLLCFCSVLFFTIMLNCSQQNQLKISKNKNFSFLELYFSATHFHSKCLQWTIKQKCHKNICNNLTICCPLVEDYLFYLSLPQLTRADFSKTHLSMLSKCPSFKSKHVSRWCFVVQKACSTLISLKVKT